MSTKIDEDILLIKEIAAKGLKSQGAGFSVSADGRMHHNWCANQWHTKDLAYHRFVANPEKYLHEECYDAFREESRDQMWGKGRRGTLKNLLIEAEFVLAGHKFDNDPKEVTFDANIKMLQLLETQSRFGYHFDKKVYRNLGYLQDEFKVAEKRMEITRHLVNVHFDEVVNLLVHEYGATNDLLIRAKANGTFDQVKKLLEEVEELAGADERVLMLGAYSHSKSYDGRCRQSNISSWIQGDYYLGCLLAEVITKNSEGGTLSQVPMKLAGAWMRHKEAYMPLHSAVEMPQTLTSLELMTFNKLYQRRVEEREDKRFAAREAYRTTISLR